MQQRSVQIMTYEHLFRLFLLRQMAAVPAGADRRRAHSWPNLNSATSAPSANVSVTTPFALKKCFLNVFGARTAGCKFEVTS